MIDAVFSWIKDIAFYMILMTVIFNMIPNMKYQRYLKIFAGMIMVILAISPLMGFLNLDSSLERFFLNITFQEEVNELKPLLAESDDKRLQAIIDEYSNVIIRDVASRANEEGFQVVEADIRLCQDWESSEFGNIEQVVLTVSYGIGQRDVTIQPVRIGNEEDTENEIGDTAVTADLKKKLLHDYGLAEEQVRIGISE